MRGDGVDTSDSITSKFLNNPKKESLMGEEYLLEMHHITKTVPRCYLR